MQFDAEHRKSLALIAQWRRDVRHFRVEPVDETILDRLQSTMDTAPSVGNARPWRVIRVNDPAVRAQVRQNFIACNTEAAEAYSGDQRAAYMALKLAGLDRAPVHLAVFTDTNPPQGHGLGRQTQPETLQQSTAMAIQLLWLAVRAENLGLGMVSILQPAAIEALFAVPNGWVFSAYLCLGWPEAYDDTPLLHRVGWQENTPTRWAVR